MTAGHSGYGILRSVLERARQEVGCSLSELTALSAQVDPYRLDTPAGHRDGQWLAKQLDKAIGGFRRIHWRGLHYVLVSGKRPVVKPDGEVYRNTDDDWIWMSGVAGKAARWLGYIPFEREATDLLLQVVSRRYERASIGITTNLAFMDWTKVFPDPMAASAVVDRLVH